MTLNKMPTSLKKKYQILIDYGFEGMKFWDEGHDDLDGAVKVAQASNYGSDFYIIEIVNWEAKLR